VIAFVIAGTDDAAPFEKDVANALFILTDEIVIFPADAAVPL
jgi:hypothetical protein